MNWVRLMKKQKWTSTGTTLPTSHCNRAWLMHAHHLVLHASPSAWDWICSHLSPSSWFPQTLGRRTHSTSTASRAPRRRMKMAMRRIMLTVSISNSCLICFIFLVCVCSSMNNFSESANDELYYLLKVVWHICKTSLGSWKELRSL